MSTSPAGPAAARACGVKLRTADQAPGDAGGVDAADAPEVRRRPAARRSRSIDAVTDASRTSGAVNALESSIWIVYDTALGTSLQSK